MSKIKPISVLPYEKRVVPVNTNVKSVNTSNALSTSKQESKEISKDIFGVVETASGYYKAIKESSPENDYQTASHPTSTPVSILDAITVAWKKRF